MTVRPPRHGAVRRPPPGWQQSTRSSRSCTAITLGIDPLPWPLSRSTTCQTNKAHSAVSTADVTHPVRPAAAVVAAASSRRRTHMHAGNGGRGGGAGVGLTSWYSLRTCCWVCSSKLLPLQPDSDSSGHAEGSLRTPVSRSASMTNLRRETHVQFLSEEMVRLGLRRSMWDRWHELKAS